MINQIYSVSVSEQSPRLLCASIRSINTGFRRSSWLLRLPCDPQYIICLCLINWHYLSVTLSILDWELALLGWYNILAIWIREVRFELMIFLCLTFWKSRFLSSRKCECRVWSPMFWFPDRCKVLLGFSITNFDQEFGFCARFYFAFNIHESGW